MSRGQGRRQLFLRAPTGTEAFLSYQQGTVRKIDIGGLPLSTWPDGRWCIEIAEYLGDLLSQRRSLFDRGGTLGTYNSELSPIVRYCYANAVDFHCLTDAHFVLFIRGLAAEKRVDGEQVKSNATILRIGRRTLSFLDFAGRRRHIADYLSPNGAFIQAYKKTFTKKLSGNRSVHVEYWHHACFPCSSGVNRCNPVTEHNVNLLRRAAATTSHSSAQKIRRLAILRFLEATGARRSELVNLKVTDVRKAKEMDRPFIDLITVKRRGPPEVRKVPISHAELDFLIDYIDLYRAPIVERRFGINDHGLVFINIKTGAGIRPNTVTLELHILRKAAGIKEKAHPHLFRHRFFTMKVFRFIVANKVRDAQQFFELCMQVDHLKFEIMQETGLKSEDTLHRYVDWAFALMPLLKEDPSPSIDMQRIAREGRAEVAELQAERDALDTFEYANRVERALVRLVGELSRAEGYESERNASSAILAEAVGLPKR
ncbi:tyrosine-type recombinase/integrase [Burkholderia sp. JPY481]